MEYEKNKIQELEGKIFEMESILRDNRDKERIYQEILSDINSSIINLFKREETVMCNILNNYRTTSYCKIYYS
jgi:hypothetical protein